MVIMGFQIIRSGKSKEIKFGNNRIAEILSTKRFSIAKVRKIGNDSKLGYHIKSDAAYYVLEGEGDIVVNRRKYYLKKGDFVFYPKGTRYKHHKGLTLLAIDSPPFDRKDRVYVK